MPSKSTELRLEHFDEHVYTADSSTTLYKFLDALCGDAGAGTLKKEIFIQRISGAIENIYGSDLDYIFGNMRFLCRSPEESYNYNTATEMLTSDQWDEVAVKDAWYQGADHRVLPRRAQRAAPTRGSGAVCTRRSLWTARSSRSGATWTHSASQRRWAALR